MSTIDYSRAFAPAPERFNRRIERTLALLEERRARRIPVKAVVIAAVILILLAGAALALTARWGVWDFLTTGSARPSGEAKALIANSPAPPVKVGEATFTLTDAAYDGERVFVAVRVQADRLGVVGEGWASQDGGPAPGEPVLTAGLGALAADGVQAECDSIDFRYSRDGTDLYAEYLLGERITDLSIELPVSLTDEHFTQAEHGVLSFRLPARAEPCALGAKVPAALDGITVTRLDARYTPFRLYVDASYEIDPALGKFDRMRRQSMTLTLLGEAGEELDMLNSSGFEGDITQNRIHAEWNLPVKAQRTLTLRFRGQDGDPYGDYIIDPGGKDQ